MNRFKICWILLLFGATTSCSKDKDLSASQNTDSSILETDSTRAYDTAVDTYDLDTNTDSSVASDLDTDTDNDVDTDTDTDTDTDADADSDADTDGDGDTETPGDADTNSEMSTDFEPDTASDSETGHLVCGIDFAEVPNNEFDDDCDGLTDESESSEACTCTETTGPSISAFTCAVEIGCYQKFMVEPPTISSPTNSSLRNGADADLIYGAVNRFGSTTNDLAPMGRTSYGLLATGPINGTSTPKGLLHNVDMDRDAGDGLTVTDPYSSDGSLIDDAYEYSVKLKAPENATGFAIDYVFFSTEYDDFVGNDFNDKFYIVLEDETSTSGKPVIINYTACRDPDAYFDSNGDNCDLPAGYCCYIAINTAMSDCCWYGGCPNGNANEVGTDISGTGFACADDSEGDLEMGGSSTGWLTTTWKVEPGEVFRLIFHIHDTMDGLMDSEVIIDNFRWITEDTIEQGTTIIVV